MELFPRRLRNFWKYWELRVLVLLSLMLQIVLIIFSNRRKYTSKTWIRIVLWCAYFMADWIATVALSVISNHLEDTTESIGKDGSLIDNIRLTIFWFVGSQIILPKNYQFKIAIIHKNTNIYVEISFSLKGKTTG